MAMGGWCSVAGSRCGPSPRPAPSRLERRDRLPADGESLVGSAGESARKLSGGRKRKRKRRKRATSQGGGGREGRYVCRPVVLIAAVKVFVVVPRQRVCQALRHGTPTLDTDHSPRKTEYDVFFGRKFARPLKGTPAADGRHDTSADSGVEPRTRTRRRLRVSARPRRRRLGAMSYQAGGFDAAEGERADAAYSKKVLCLP